MSYQPSIEDIAYLAQNQPEHFSSPATTLRSIQNAMQADEVQRETLEAITAQNHYNDFLANDGQALTESPIPSMPLPVLEGRPQAQDPEFGAVCTVCASQTPCIEKVEVVCHTHAKSNQRVTLQGENELVDTECKIYFVADKFVTGEGTLEDFFEGTQLKDEGNVAITIAGDCSHGQHTLYWTDELNGTELPPGATTTLDFTVMTRPVPPIPIPNPVMGMSHEAKMAFKVAVMLLQVLMRRSHMVNEQSFRITYDGTNDFCFTTVTLPQFKIDGSVTVVPPNLERHHVEKSDGRSLAQEMGMGSRVRQETQRQGWGVEAALNIVCGAATPTITVGNEASTTTTYDTGPSLRRANNQQQQKSAVERFIDTLTDASQRIAKNLSATESDDDQLLSFFTHGPAITVGATTEQVEEEGGPGLTHKITPGISLIYEFGIRLDIYLALKMAARKTPHGRALVLFLENLEEGIDTYMVQAGLKAKLYMEVALGVGPSPTEDGLGNHTLRVTYDFQEQAFDSPEGEISITLRAVVGGGIIGYFDSVVTEETVFNYEVTLATSGSISLTIEDGQWGYRLSHTGAVLRVQGYKKADVESGGNEPVAGGRPTPNHHTQHSSAQVIETADGQGWVADGEAHAYRLADSWQGAFHPFT
ncbi:MULTISPECIES: hypothetical protein [Halomonadaceae]|uniref:Uncharacterized protein n=1 Tax=Vreelandella titanicae TaxID=664683 RepID=A0AAP9NRH6_9GAMM|nr:MULTISPECIES: hypothetical protein [Halomonas]QKS25702.1 hypothetical protein FX987_03498 [Halomonas titanicae]CDG53097.1 hypothetical protein HALA3H3_470107 [Halomonas sp. A3H3]SDI67678.1 hypothetical protein SAMN04487867_11142 [Halomonas titanicae]|tara:strand:- start:270 stop:2204 length:1935 start_codon:yes stop_codon:yes gene_type:complete